MMSNHEFNQPPTHLINAKRFRKNNNTICMFYRFDLAYYF